MLAGLLERLERSAAPVDAEQYRALVERLRRALAAELPAEALDAVLGRPPGRRRVVREPALRPRRPVPFAAGAAVAAETAARDAAGAALARLSRSPTPAVACSVN